MSKTSKIWTIEFTKYCADFFLCKEYLRIIKKFEFSSYLYFIEGVVEGGLDGVSSSSLNDSTDCVWMIKGVFKESLVSIIIDATESFFQRLLTNIQSLEKPD